MSVQTILSPTQAEAFAEEILDNDDTTHHDLAVKMLRAASLGRSSSVGAVVVDIDEIWKALGREPQ